MQDTKRRKYNCKRNKRNNPPRRPMTGYMYFLKERRPHLWKDNPDASMCKITTLAAEEWRRFSEEQKQPYHQQSLASKQKYEKDMRAYMKANKSLDKEKGAQKRKLSAFFAYVRERRKTLKEVNGSIRSAEIIRRIAEEWRSMDNAQKAKYEDIANKKNSCEGCNIMTQSVILGGKDLSKAKKYNEIMEKIVRVDYAELTTKSEEVTAKMSDIKNLLQHHS